MSRPSSGHPPWEAVAVKLPPELLRQARRYADLYHTSMSLLLREGLERRLGLHAVSSAADGPPAFPTATVTMLEQLALTLTTAAREVRNACQARPGKEYNGYITTRKEEYNGITMAGESLAEQPGDADHGRVPYADDLEDMPLHPEPPPAITETPAVPDFDPKKFTLGVACKYGHCSHGDLGNLRALMSRKCVMCEEKKKAARQASTPPALVTPPMMETLGGVAATVNYDTSKYALGRLCIRGHDYQRTGQTLLLLPRRRCLSCENELKRAKRQAKR